MSNTKNKIQSWQSQADKVGQIAELKVNSKLRHYGRISLPYGDAPYDVLLETKAGGFIKCQTKHGKLKHGVDGHMSVTFRTTDRNGNQYSNDDVHAFTVYSSELDKVWIVPFDCCNKTQQSLAITLSNRSSALPAEDFTPEKILKGYY